MESPPKMEIIHDAKLRVREIPKKILLVDDNHINLKILSAYMKKLKLSSIRQSMEKKQWISTRMLQKAMLVSC